jgi:hypothetical protein
MHKLGLDFYAIFQIFITLTHFIIHSFAPGKEVQLVLATHGKTGFG